MNGKNRRQHLICLMLLGLLFHNSVCGREWSHDERLREQQQLDLWQKKLSDITNAPQEDKIEDLAQGLRGMEFRKQFGGRDPRTDLIYSEIQAALIAIPGHAEYYANRILAAQERLKNPGGGITWSEYLKEVMYGFQTLKLLPSAESVRVLGGMLSNDWVLPGNETRDLSERVPILSQRATIALAGFPLKDKPFKERLTSKNDKLAHAAWLQWYEEVKSGKRTFRFEGDPTEYDLNGPAPGQKLANISRERKRDAERLTGIKRIAEQDVVAESANDNENVKQKLAPLVIAGMILLISLRWYLMRGRGHVKS